MYESLFLHIRYIAKEYGLSSYNYEGHRVTVKVTGAKKVENLYFRNVILRSAVTRVLQCESKK